LDTQSQTGWNGKGGCIELGLFARNGTGESRQLNEVEHATLWRLLIGTDT